MSNLNQQIKAAAEPGVLKVIDWALMVHEDTMQIVNDVARTESCVGRYSLYEREEARKILLEYGAGKPTRIVEHRGSKKNPICFETEIVGPPKLLKEPDNTIDAEFTE